MRWVAIVLMGVAAVAVAQETEPLPHPETGERGFWVPRADFELCLVCFEEKDILEQQIEDLEENHEKTVALYEARIEELETKWWEWLLLGLAGVLGLVGVFT